MTKQEFLSAALATLMTVLPVAVKAEDNTQKEQKGFEVRKLKFNGKDIKVGDNVQCITADDKDDAGFFENPTTLVGITSFTCKQGNIVVTAAMKEASNWNKLAAVVGVGVETAVAVSQITAEQKQADAAKKYAGAAADGALADKITMTNSQEQSQETGPINVEGANVSVGDVSAVGTGGDAKSDSTAISKSKSKSESDSTAINKTDIDIKVKNENDNTNVNKNKNDNTNVNKNKNKVEGGNNGGHGNCNKRDKHGRPTCFILRHETGKGMHARIARQNLISRAYV